MIKLKKFGIISLAVLSILALSLSFILLGSRQVKAEWETEEEPIALTYNLGYKLTIPEYKLMVKGNAIESTYSLELPDGNYVSGKNHTLSSIGVYTVHYYSEFENKGYSKDFRFEVKNMAYVFSSNKTETTYARYNRNLCDSDALIVRLSSGDEIKFNHIINCADLNMDNSIIEGFIAPDNMGNADFNKLIVRLTDSVNPENYVDIEYNRSQYGTISGSSFVGVAAAAKGQDMIGLEINANSFKVHKNDNFGALITHSFIAKTNANGGWSTPLVDYKNDSKLFTLTFDYENCSIYSQGVYVTKLNDANYYEKIWNGFDSGKVKLSVRADGYLATTANFCITKVFGLTKEELSTNSFDGALEPILTINTDYEKMPIAEKGNKYSIPSASAIDYAFGKCDVKVKVYYNYASIPISVSVIDNTFTPDRLGKYTIEYTATNPLGIESQKILVVDSVEKVDELTVSNPQNRTIISECGKEIEIKAPIVIGGSGIPTVKTTASLRNKEYVIEDGKFTPEEAGDWTITYEVEDYLGRCVTSTYMIVVEKGKSPIISKDITLPKAYISNSKYEIPSVHVLDYTSGKLVKSLCDCVVTDANGEKTYKANETFVPVVNASGDKIQMKFVCGETTSEIYEIPVIIGLEGKNVYQDRYFIGDEISVTTEGLKSGIGIEVVAGTDGKWFFANELLSGGCSISIGASDETNFKGYQFTFISAVNGKKVTATLKQINVITALFSVLEEEIELSYNISSNDPFTITYSAEKVIFSTDTIKTSIPVVKYDDGSAFDDFNDGSNVYLEVSTIENKIDAKYIVYSVSGMNLSSRNRDNIEPNINIFGAVSGSYSIGDIYTVCKAAAGDTCAPNVSLTLTATDKEGNIISDIDGLKLENVSCDREYKVRLSEYGVISFTYTASEIDWTGNTKTFVNAITVIDEISPVITFTSEAQKTAKVGSTIVMPDFTVSDNITEKENIIIHKYVINGEGKFVYIEGNSNSIIARYAGKYTFLVYATDEFGNSSSAYYEVEVAE